MNPQDAIDAIIAQLEASSVALAMVKVYENVHQDTNEEYLLPRMEIDFPGIIWRSPALDDSVNMYDAIMSLQVVTEKGVGTHIGLGYAAQLQDLFQKKTQIAISGAVITFMTLPQIQPGFLTTKGWHIPVLFDFRVSKVRA